MKTQQLWISCSDDSMLLWDLAKRANVRVIEHRFDIESRCHEPGVTGTAVAALVASR